MEAIQFTPRNRTISTNTHKNNKKHNMKTKQMETLTIIKATLEKLRSYN